MSTEDPQSTCGRSLPPFLHFPVTAISVQTCDPPEPPFIHCPHWSILLPGAKSSELLIAQINPVPSASRSHFAPQRARGPRPTVLSHHQGLKTDSVTTLSLAQVSTLESIPERPHVLEWGSD